MGNLHSIAKALQHSSSNDETIVITGDPKTILSADKVVFPGVGAMRDCMQALLQVQRAAFQNQGQLLWP